MLSQPAALMQMALFANLSGGEAPAHSQRAAECRFADSEMLLREGPRCAGIFLILEGAYPESVRAIGAEDALVLHKTRLQRACPKNPEALKGSPMVGERLHHLVEVVGLVIFGGVNGRQPHPLLETARQGGSDAFDLPVTPEERVARLGTVREVVSHNLARLRTGGIARVDDRRVRILDRAPELQAEPAAAFR
ncbi:MAG TPA: helix-turn-helix domain-containing protein [Bryobacteraceae bacterium]|nr:helix-turn-helix domain-containing protein [Bryobacteraceae bacterium]